MLHKCFIKQLDETVHSTKQCHDCVCIFKTCISLKWCCTLLLCLIDWALLNHWTPQESTWCLPLPLLSRPVPSLILLILPAPLRLLAPGALSLAFRLTPSRLLLALSITPFAPLFPSRNPAISFRLSPSPIPAPGPRNHHPMPLLSWPRLPPSAKAGTTYHVCLCATIRYCAQEKYLHVFNMMFKSSKVFIENGNRQFQAHF